jgi:hypothetical protein
MKRVEPVVLKNVCMGLLILAVGLASVACNSGRPNNAPSKKEPASYVLPSEFFLKPTVARGPEGEVYIEGTTNLPDGLIFNVDVIPPIGREPKPADYLRGDLSLDRGVVTVRSGKFRSPGLMVWSPNPHFDSGYPVETGNSKYIRVPFPPPLFPQTRPLEGKHPKFTSLSEMAAKGLLAPCSNKRILTSSIVIKNWITFN